MDGTPKEYKRLPGRGMRVEGNWFIAFSRSFCTLWLGEDHLLLLDRMGYTETYKRFYFKDIQAVMIRRTAKADVVNIALAVLALGFVGWALSVTNLAGRVTLWILGGVFALLALANFLRGPSCVAHIKTPVQIEQVPSWNRLRGARKGLDRIRPLLLEAQGAYFPDELKAELAARLQRESQSRPAQTT
jgi:hypothetical protein